MKLTLKSLLLLFALSSAFSKENSHRSLPFTYGTATTGYSNEGGLVTSVESSPLSVLNQGAIIPFRLEISLSDKELREFEISFARIEMQNKDTNFDIEFTKYMKKKLGNDKDLFQFDFVGIDLKKMKKGKDGKIKYTVEGGVAFSAGAISGETEEARNQDLKQKMSGVADFYFNFNMGMTYYIDKKISISSKANLSPTLSNQFFLGELTNKISYQLHKLNNGTSFDVYGSYKFSDTFIYDGAKGSKDFVNQGEHQMNHKLELGTGINF